MNSSKRQQIMVMTGSTDGPGSHPARELATPRERLVTGDRGDTPVPAVPAPRRPNRCLTAPIAIEKEMS